MTSMKKCICGNMHKKKSIAKKCFLRAARKSQKVCPCGIKHKKQKLYEKHKKRAQKESFKKSDFGL